MKDSGISLLLAQEVNSLWSGIIANTLGLGWEVITGDKKAIIYDGSQWTLLESDGFAMLFPDEMTNNKRGRSMQVAPVYVAHPPIKTLSMMPLRHRGVSLAFLQAPRPKLQVNFSWKGAPRAALGAPTAAMGSPRAAL